MEDKNPFKKLKNGESVKSETTNEASIGTSLNISNVVDIILQELMSAASSEDPSNLTSMRSLAMLAELRLWGQVWKNSVEHYCRCHLKSFTIEVDLSHDDDRKVIEQGKPRREKKVISFDEAMSFSSTAFSENFHRITGTLDSNRRPSMVYEVLQNGPLIRLTGAGQLNSFVRFLKAVSATTDNKTGQPTVSPMSTESLSLVIIEKDKKPKFQTEKEWPTIEALLNHLPHLKQLIFTVFTDNRIKGDRPFKQLVPQLVTYLVDSRVNGLLVHLDLNLNDSVFGPAEDYSALLPLMPQLVHFGLNAEATGESVMRLLMAASSRLTSLKMDIVHCKESDFAETLKVDEQTDRLKVNSKIANFSFLKSLTSLTLIDCEYSQFTDYWLKHFTALNTLVLGEKAGLDNDDFHNLTFNLRNLAPLPLLSRVTLVGFSKTSIPRIVVLSLPQCTDLSLVQCRFTDNLPHTVLGPPVVHPIEPVIELDQVCSLHLIKTAFQLTARPGRLLTSLQSLTLLDRCESENLEEVEAAIRERIERKGLCRFQLYLRSGYPVPYW
ncbi:hypothetical protein TYRP_020692 [Tyrophagus putrescentiae]|nr:hypothetical protein TYRP_020692 [Tyrophagus putrescentiae]